MKEEKNITNLENNLKRKQKEELNNETSKQEEFRRRINHEISFCFEEQFQKKNLHSKYIILFYLIYLKVAIL